MKKISIIGSGVVGTIIGNGFRELGHEVIFHDIVDKKLPNFTKDITHAANNSEISFICVPTPTENGKIDLSYVKNAVEGLAHVIKKKRDYHLVVIKSTVVPMTTENVIIPLLEKVSGKKCGDDFGVCVNPEFLTEIHKTWTDDPSFARGFFTEDRIVIGEFDKKSGDILEELYKPLDKPIFRVDLKTAEFIKYVANCALPTKISYWNEIFLISKDLGIDSQKVAYIVGLDPRIGKYGTIHGKAFGGKCFPKDLEAFISFIKENCRHDPILLKAVQDINKHMAKKYGIRE